jgi:8-oxo-dGTP diphosphatase
MSADPADLFATPRVAAGVLIRDQASRLLLVKPTYKDGWEIRAAT